MLCEYLQAERFEVHSLFFRIFILFWVAMALIVGGSMALTLAVASRDNESSDTERRPEMAVRASQVLAGGGIGDLRQCGPACSAR